MIDVSFVRPNYPGENRVALLPKDVGAILNANIRPVIESGFGASLGICDEAYEAVGALVVSRREAFSIEMVFSLKLIQPSDFEFLRYGHAIIGWMHPSGSGREFFSSIAFQKNLRLIDLDSVYPRLYCRDVVIDLAITPSHFFWKNSMYAGMASVLLAQQSVGLFPDVQKNVAVLGSGSVSQGAFIQLSRLGFNPRMFYRKTLSLFYPDISNFDIIVNGIEVDHDAHILSANDIRKTKRNCLIIDAAADAGRAVEGTCYNSFENPVGSVFDRNYVLVNNAPSLLFNEASENISTVLAAGVLKQSLDALMRFESSC